MTGERHVLRVPDSDLEDLRARLRGARWPTSWPRQDAGAGWEAGADEGELLPVVLTHGWPSSFLELAGLARRLAAPSRHGGDPGDAFTVIVPALPGFPLSPQRPDLPPATPTHELWHRLMQDELGFSRYGAHGGDLGAGVTSRLAEVHPEAVAGIHLLAVGDPPGYDPATVTPEERRYLDETAAWFADAGGYEHEQMTRPRTLAYGLSDSPGGLLAWLVEKYREWSDCDGDLSRRFSDDFILTRASLYWFTNAISTSFRPYREHARGMAPPVKHVAVPTAVAVFPKDLTHPPRSWPSAPTTPPGTPPCRAAATLPPTRSQPCSPMTSPSSSGHCGNRPRESRGSIKRGEATSPRLRPAAEW
jgi:pimeloyl-ACP methyl ester carboxylesterase